MYKQFISILIFQALSYAMLAISVSAQEVNAERFATLVSPYEGEGLGTIIKKADQDEDGFPELFIGAPNASNNQIVDFGRIYLFELPIDSDSILSDQHIIMEGVSNSELLGANFELKDFNNDGVLDLITGNSFANDGSGEVKIFLGPFTSGQIRTTDQYDFRIKGVSAEEFGNSFSIVDSVDGQNQVGLLVGANAYDGFTGRAYFFKNSLQQREMSSSEADVIFNGVLTFDLFGDRVLSLGDISGSGSNYFAISAPKHTNTAPLQGAIYLFKGPFDEAEYDINDASTVILGRAASQLWPGRMFSFDDFNNDGLKDFSLSSDGDNRGTMALFRGREVWPDTIQIGDNIEELKAHTLFQFGNSYAGFGSSIEINGDYNFDGINDILIGAPLAGGNYGSVVHVNQFGTNVKGFEGALSSIGGFFGTSILALPNTNSEEIDPFKIDDFVVGAPYASAYEKYDFIQSGALSFFTGKLNPPRVSMSTTTNKAVVEIGDSIQVNIQAIKGSRPIERNVLYVTYNQKNKGIVRDSIFFDTGQSSTNSEWFKLSNFGTIGFNSLISDDFDITATESNLVYFAGKPSDFNLITEFDEIIEIEGKGNEIITFESEASIDTNNASLRYRLVVANSLESFATNVGVSILKYSNTPKFNMSLIELNNLAINFGYLNLNVPGTIYWSIDVTNSSQNVNFFTIRSRSESRPLEFIRRGLDPSFSLTGSLNKNLVVQGFDTDEFNFTWSELVTENPNAVVDYYFKLVADTTQESLDNPIYEAIVNPESGTSYQLSYGELNNLLVENDLKEQAQSDTVKWYYTFEAVIDGNLDDPVLPNQRFGQLDIQFVVIVSSTDEEIEDIANQQPNKFVIYPNFPNPFNPKTNLKFSIPKANNVSIVVYNMLGQIVHSWNSNGLLRAGFHEHPINGQSWSSGIYIYQIQVGRERLTGKMSLVK